MQGHKTTDTCRLESDDYDEVTTQIQHFLYQSARSGLSQTFSAFGSPEECIFRFRFNLSLIF